MWVPDYFDRPDRQNKSLHNVVPKFFAYDLPTPEKNIYFNLIAESEKVFGLSKPCIKVMLSDKRPEAYFLDAHVLLAFSTLLIFFGLLIFKFFKIYKLSNGWLRFSCNFNHIDAKLFGLLERLDFTHNTDLLAIFVKEPKLWRGNLVIETIKFTRLRVQSLLLV